MGNWDLNSHTYMCMLRVLLDGATASTCRDCSVCPPCPHGVEHHPMMHLKRRTLKETGIRTARAAFLAHGKEQQLLMMHIERQEVEHGRQRGAGSTCRDCSARSMYSMVSRRAQKAGTAPWRTMDEQEEGSTSARKVSARAASSIRSGLCSEFSRCTCAGALPSVRRQLIACISV